MSLSNGSRRSKTLFFRLLLPFLLKPPALLGDVVVSFVASSPPLP
jgi:hypothetical protein